MKINADGFDLLFLFLVACVQRTKSLSPFRIDISAFLELPLLKDVAIAIDSPRIGLRKWVVGVPRSFVIRERNCCK